MNIDITDLLVAIVPSLITAYISYKGATIKANSEIFAVKESTNRALESIKADTSREIEKIKADTEREIEKIKAETDKEIRVIEAKSKSKETEMLNEEMLSFFVPLLSDPKNLGDLLKLGSNPSEKELADFFTKRGNTTE